MNVTFLSTGWALPTPERSGTALLLRGPETVLMDCGGDVAQKMLKTGHPLESLDRVLLTHGHPDHLAGLPGLVHANMFVDRERPLRIEGPRHAVDRARELLDLFDIEPEFRLELEALTGEGSDGELIWMEAHHSLPALSYRWGSVAFTGDTEAHEGLVDLARGADLLVAEATGPDPETARRYRHLSPQEAGEVAAAAGVNTLAIVHTHPSMDEEETAEAAGFDRVLLPGDLDEISTG